MKPVASLGLLADSITDSSSTRTVYLLAAALTALGLGLLFVTIWFWKSSRPEPEFLAPLETMEDKRFRLLGRLEQRRLLDAARPADAKPINKSVVVGAPPASAQLDLRAIGRSRAMSMDDLKEVVETPVAVEPVVDSTSSEGIAIDPLLRMFDREEI